MNPELIELHELPDLTPDLSEWDRGRPRRLPAAPSDCGCEARAKKPTAFRARSEGGSEPTGPDTPSATMSCAAQRFPPLPFASTLSTLIAISVLCPGSAAVAEVTRLEVTDRAPYAGGREFPGVGAYELLRGRVHYAVDPEAPANRPVVDLRHAPRDAAGRVEFSADLTLLAPVDRGKANGTLLYDVNNRGGLTAVGLFNGGAGADQFLMRQGYIVVSSGWIGELLPGGGRLRLHAPVATEAGRPIRGLVRAELTPGAGAGERMTVAQSPGHGSYRPTERGLREATLTWRQREKDPRVAVPRGQFRLEVQPLPAEARSGEMPQVDLVLPGGFRPGYIYELVYEAEGPLVMGLGMAAIRDLVSFLKHDGGDRNPLRRPDGRPAADKAVGFGVSQSGRALRMFVYDGFNADEQGRIVFDGLMPHVAGAGLGSFNHRFASPARTNGQHEGHQYPVDVFPFAYGDEKDPFTGRTDGILRRARAAGVVPKVMHTQTSAEYWHRSGSLVHTDPLGKKDAAIPQEVRVYAIGGSQHSPGSGVAGERGAGWLPANPTDYRPLLRALLTAMNAWVRDGEAPPPSRYPRIGDGTLVGWREAQSGWRALPGVRYPEVIQQPEYLDHGPGFLTERRLTRVPPVPRGDYAVRVPAYGPDDNERGMLQPPSVAVPVATFTGWNLRGPQIGAEGELLSLTGGYIPFARTRAEREASGDPRPSLAERYPSFEAYLEQFATAARDLVRQRYLLEEDLPGLLELAGKQRQQWQEQQPGPKVR